MKNGREAELSEKDPSYVRTRVKNAAMRGEEQGSRNKSGAKRK